MARQEGGGGESEISFILNTCSPLRVSANFAARLAITQPASVRLLKNISQFCIIPENRTANHMFFIQFC